MNDGTTMMTNHLLTAFNGRTTFCYEEELIKYMNFFFMNNTFQNNIKQIIQDIPNKIGT